MSMLSKLAVLARLPIADVEYLINNAPRRYKVYPIPKRGGGFRTIAQPAREIKTLQRAMITLAPKTLVVHSAATAYEQNCSILKNAERHSESRWIARLDFSNFFNSITSESWLAFLRQMDVDDEFSKLSSSLFFWRPKRSNETCLSVGAPSSPFASNRIMRTFDEEFTACCADKGLIYTRYADDLTVSGSEAFSLSALKEDVENSLPDFLSLQLNPKKSRFSGPGQRRVVTGLIVANDNAVTIGKKKRKLLEARVHSFVHGEADLTEEQLAGHLQFLFQVEPKRYRVLKEKYGKSAPSLFHAESD